MRPQDRVEHARGAADSLLVRFRRTLGLSSLAALTMASGPCGACYPEESACYERSELVLLRESALASVEAAGGAAGAAGEVSVEERAQRMRAAPGAGGAPVPFDQVAHDLEQTETWDNAEGCPTRDQIDSIWRLNGREPPAWNTLASTSDEQCCYKTYADCPGGRPFLVAGSARVATLALDLALDEACAPAASEDAEFRRALGERWAAEALTEHASVAAFARLTLQLLAFGAPVALLEASQRAALDELEHARFCFAQASHLLGRNVAPGPLALDGAFANQSFAEFVRTNVLEGCIGETLAALHMSERARLSGDPALSTALLTISEDEARHAELAFRILSWCLDREPRVTRRVVAEVIATTRSAHAETSSLDRMVWERTLLPIFEEVVGSRAERVSAVAQPAVS